MEHRQQFLFKKLAAKAKKNSFICTSAFYSFKLLLFFQAIVMCFSNLVCISVIRLISLYIEQHPHEKKNEKMKRAVLSRPFKVILLCLAFIAVTSFWSRNTTLAERNESVAFQERSMIFTSQSEKIQLIDSDPAYNPESCQFDKCHPCCNYVDITIDYGQKDNVHASISSASSKRPRYDVAATKAARDIYLAVDMHRCCPTCHK